MLDAADFQHAFGTMLASPDPSNDPAMRRALESAGITFGRIAAAQPSVEDLFVALLQNERPPA